MAQFAKLFKSLFPRRDLNWIAKGVYAYLLDLQGEKGRCWPPERVIADRCGVTRGAVRKAISSLKAAGLITVTRTGDNGKGVTLYRVMAPDDTENVVHVEYQVVHGEYQDQKETVVLPVDQPWSTESTSLGTQGVPDLVHGEYHTQTYNPDLRTQTEESDLAEGGFAASASSRCRDSAPPLAPKAADSTPAPAPPPTPQCTRPVPAAPPPPPPTSPEARYQMLPEPYREWGEYAPPPVPECGPMHDALVQAFNLRNLTKADIRKIHEAAVAIEAKGAKPEDVAERLAAFRTRWPNVHPKPDALVANWDKLGPQLRLVG